MKFSNISALFLLISNSVSANRDSTPEKFTKRDEGRVLLKRSPSGGKGKGGKGGKGKG